MLRCIAALVAAFMVASWLSVAHATAAAGPDSGSAERVLAWIKTYRTKPDRKLLPEAVVALGASGAFQEPDAAGVFVGFMAGVIGSNPDHAEKLVKKMLAVRPEDNWAVVRAVAYSGLPDWRGMLARTTDLAPNRQSMIDAYVSGKLATLEDLASANDRARSPA